MNIEYTILTRNNLNQKWEQEQKLAAAGDNHTRGTPSFNATNFTYLPRKTGAK